MRTLASGLVVVSVIAVGLGLGLGAGCGDRKSGGLPPADEWKPPPGSGSAAAAPPEAMEARLARCAAGVFVADAVRDGNVPSGILDDLTAVPDPLAIVILRALQHAAARFPAADQHAALLADTTFRLVERGETATAGASLGRAAGLLGRSSEDEVRTSIAAATIARTLGRLGDATAIQHFRQAPALGPHLARGLAEGGHAELADEVYADLMVLPDIDPFAAAELAIVDLIRGRADMARARVAARPADWRSAHALLLATAAVERKDPAARTLVDDAALAVDAEQAPPPSMTLEVAELVHAVGDAAGAAQRRARIRAALAGERDERRAWQALSTLHGLALRAGAADEAQAIFGDLEARRAPPWMIALTRTQGLVLTGRLKQAVEEVERQPPDSNPPRGVVYVEVLLRYFAGPREPDMERWLDEHMCT